MAIAALVCSILFAPLGIILGHIARGQIKRSNEGRHGLATPGMIIGYAFTVIPVLLGIVAVTILFAVPANDDHTHISPPASETVALTAN